MKPRLENKVALVTGAASGIGRAAARRLTNEGAHVIVADRDAAGLQTLTAEMAREGLSAAALTYDAASAKQSRAMVQAALAQAGRLDCLVNCAGIYRRNHFAKISPQDWSLVLATNLDSLFHILQEALPSLVATRGNAVNIASTAALTGIAYAAPYAAAKAGVIALTRSLALEYAPAGVRLNVICPGRVRTNIGAGLQPLDNQDAALLLRDPRLSGRVEGGTPEDIAGIIAFLASGDSAYVTGSVIVADGAQMLG